MKRFFACMAVVGWVVAGYATDSRIAALGGHDAFFMDDYSIYRNPANVNIYPNLLIASSGLYVQTKAEKQDSLAALRKANRDPIRPYGGGILSYSFNEGNEAGSQYPMFSLGMTMNRHDEMLDYVTWGEPEFDTAFAGSAGDIDMYPDPVGKFDLLLGYAFPGGGMIGLGSYVAFQQEGADQEASLYRFNVGMNLPVARTTDLEGSVGIGLVSAAGLDTATGESVPLASFADNGDFAAKFDLRLFSALTVINGDFVPHVSVDLLNFKKYSLLSVAGGLGVNINIDRGFTWGGLEFLYETREPEVGDASSGLGGRLSLGLERNLVWDWFLLRGGLNKELLFVTTGDTEDGRWEQNPEADGTEDDFANVGIGLNFENRLRVDWVLGMDFLHTGGNLISGPQHHLFSRMTFTYSF